MPLLTRNRLLTLLGLAAASAVAYARFVEPDWLYVRYIQLTLPRLPREFHDFRLAHISDIHMGGWMTRERLQNTVTIINRIQPDAVAITGDFADKNTHSVGVDLIEPLRQLKPLTVSVMGNHDYYHGINTVRRILEKSGIIDLRNCVHTLQRGTARLHLAGVDDVVMRQHALDRVLEHLPGNDTAVLLAHEPDFADVSAATGRFDLQLSGHTHGGQVRLPLLGTPILPSHGVRYPSGLYTVGEMYQYTNRGLGMIAPYTRFGMRPELTILILENAAKVRRSSRKP